MGFLQVLAKNRILSAPMVVPPSPLEVSWEGVLPPLYDAMQHGLASTCATGNMSTAWSAKCRGCFFSTACLPDLAGHRDGSCSSW